MHSLPLNVFANLQKKKSNKIYRDLTISHIFLAGRNSW